MIILGSWYLPSQTGSISAGDGNVAASGSRLLVDRRETRSNVIAANLGLALPAH
jgi:hypothetical protein